MPHAREQIREALKTKLIVAATDAGANVYVDRPYPHEKSKLPSLVIRSPLEEISDAYDTTGGTYTRHLTVAIEARVAVASTSAPEQALDDLCAQVEVAVGSDPTLTGLVTWMNLVTTEIDIDGEQEKVVGLATMTFRALYKTASNDPTTVHS